MSRVRSTLHFFTSQLEKQLWHVSIVSMCQCANVSYLTSILSYWSRSSRWGLVAIKVVTARHVVELLYNWKKTPKGASFSDFISIFALSKLNLLVCCKWNYETSENSAMTNFGGKWLLPKDLLKRETIKLLNKGLAISLFNSNWIYEGFTKVHIQKTKSNHNGFVCAVVLSGIYFPVSSRRVQSYRWYFIFESASVGRHELAPHHICDGADGYDGGCS